MQTGFPKRQTSQQCDRSSNAVCGGQDYIFNKLWQLIQAPDQQSLQVCHPRTDTWQCLEGMNFLQH